jgi:hypothetical protein
MVMKMGFVYVMAADARSDKPMNVHKDKGAARSDSELECFKLQTVARFHRILLVLRICFQ